MLDFTNNIILVKLQKIEKCSSKKFLTIIKKQVITISR